MLHSAFDCDLAALGVVDGAESPEFDKFVDLARALTGAPVAFLSVVEPEKDRQFFTAQRGLPEWAARARQTPLSHSFCRHVRSSGATLMVENAVLHPLVHDNLAIRDLGVIAYLGAPVRGPDGAALGALCVIEPAPRRWTEAERRALEQAADCVGDLIAARAAAAASRAALDAAEAAEAAKARLLARVSHELRTPLNGILGIGAILEPTLVTEEKRRLFAIIMASGRHLLSLTEEILDWSRLKTDAFRLAAEPVDIRALAAEAASLHREAAMAKKLDFTVEIEPPSPAPRSGDRTRLLQIIHNILGNAVRLTDSGGVRLRIFAADGAALRIEVEDDGPGVTPDVAEHAFEEFWRAETATTAGAGLGLPIVRRLAEAMNGEATLGPAPGGGALARVTLPLPLAA